MVRSAPLGRLLLDTGVLTQVQLDEILVVQRNDKRRLGELLVERGLVNPIELAQLLSHQLSCPWISLAHLELAPDVIALLPEELVLDHGVVPVHLRMSNGQKVLYVATDDPTDDVALAECAEAAGMPVRPMVAITGDVRDAIARLYGTESRPDPTYSANEQPKKAAEAPRPPPPLPTRKKTKATVKEPARPVTVPPENVVELAPEKLPRRAPTVLVLNAPDAFLAGCRAAVEALGATMVDGSIVRAGDLVATHRPCAIVVTEDVYAFDRSGLNRLALDNDAHLVVWSEEVDGKQLQPLLAGAIERWSRVSYEKGAIIDGRYELMRDLGPAITSNGGARWEVRNTRTARRALLAFAVRAEGEGPVNMICAEQKALARVTHHGAVELRDAGTTELGDPYVVLETLGGRTLGGLVASKAKLHVEDVSALIVQVAETLSAAHAAGVLHNEVVPENIVVARDAYGIERVKLVGWGHATLGAPGKVDPKKDVLALAVCAFEALTGRAPESGADAAKAGEVPDPLMPLLVRALAPDAAVYSTARELALAFQQAMPTARERTQLLAHAPRSREVPAVRAVPPQPAAPAVEVGTAVTAPAPAPMGRDQRRWVRAAYRTPIRIEVPGIGSIDGRTEDISGGGMLVISRFGLKIGTEVTVRFALPLDGRVVSEGAVVKWLRLARTNDTMGGRNAFGLELTAVLPETLRQIERYVSFLGTASDEEDPKSRTF
ncbi:MAG: hypothetical protein JWP97_3838 [Labilithrix sp.]|nr:hypothetical protein [Labilithrix sp.]